MINYNKPIRILSCIIVGLLFCLNGLIAQESEQTLTGVVLESGSGTPVKQAVISVASNGEYTNTDNEGKFSIKLPSSSEVLKINFPGYYTTDYYTSGKNDIVIYLTPEGFNSNDKPYTTIFGKEKINHATNSVGVITASNFDKSAYTSLNQALNGKAAGLNAVDHSGMPGHSSWLNIGGISSMYGRNQPLVMVDGMIHEINYPTHEIIEGYALNPFDVIDVDDILDMSISKVGEGSLGSAGSNGLININTEQNDVTSAAVLVKMYGGISLPIQKQEVLDAGQFKTYFTDLLNDQGYTANDIDAMYPWLNGNSSVEEYYRYNNNTDWQSQMAKPSALQKYYIYIRGGDDIATYNISSGYTRHGAPYDNWGSSKYNLRLNGKINITNKLSVIPNTKLSLSDTYLSNMGVNAERNPVLASLQKSPLMHPNEKSTIDGSVLFPNDDVGAFGISNPAAIIKDGLGAIRNFQLISSVKVGYKINSNIKATHLIGISMMNDRQNMFVPDVGVQSIDPYSLNSPMDMVNEFRSIQNNTNIQYNNTFQKKHYLEVNGGLRTMSNIYKNNFAIDLNTATDDFRSLGSGSLLDYLRTNGGEISSLSWMSLYADANYRLDDQYYLRASLSLDGSSAFNKQNRYNFYPSLFAAWRISKSSVTLPAWINDLKLRAATSITGNMFSDKYLYSKNTYTGRKYNRSGTVVKDYVTNSDLSAEKKLALNAGVDLTFGKSAFNLHVDYHLSMVNNLIINQSLPPYYGYTNYYDNSGKLNLSGIELSGDGRWHFGEYTLSVEASVTYQSSKIKDFEFINSENEFITNTFNEVTYVAMIDNPVNSFYGYKTKGILNSDSDIIGPKGKIMEAGDVDFEDVNDDGVIDERDMQIIGNPNPDLFGSLLGNLTYKRFTFSTLFTYSVGNDMYNYVRYQTTSMDSYANQSIDVQERWQPGSSGATLPKAAIGDPKGNNVFSDRWIEDASFLRLKQLKISYTTPNIWTLNKETTFYITGTNLLTLTKYTGLDPVTMYQNNAFNMGVDYGKLPLARSIIFGIQISL